MRFFIFTALLLTFVTVCFAQENFNVGQKIVGDFNGDGKLDTAYAKRTNAKRKRWELSFNHTTIPSLQLGCCNVILINEKNLDKNKGQELSVFQAPENGCIYTWTTYTLNRGKWQKFFPTFLIATDCENFKINYLESRVFVENGKVYYWDVDPNDEENKPLKRQVTGK